MVERSGNAFGGTLHLSVLSEHLAVLCLSLVRPLVRPLKPDDPERITDSSRWLSVSDTTGSDDVHCPPPLKGSKILRPIQGRRVVSFVPGVRCSAATPGYYL